MSDDKIKKTGSDDAMQDAAHRARNRTVMLNPELTGQVRARLQQDLGGGAESGYVTPGKGLSAAIVPPHTESQGTPVAPTAPRQANAAIRPIKSSSTQPLIGFLVSFDQGPAAEYFELRVGRMIITSEDNGASNNLLIADPSVSPMHAIIRVAASGSVQVLDQLSEHGTQVKRMGSIETEQLSGDKTNLENGDIIMFGQRSFCVCIIAKAEE